MRAVLTWELTQATTAKDSGALNESYAVVVDHEGRWIHNLHTGTGSSQEQEERASAHISTETTEGNHIRIIALNEGLAVHQRAISI